MYLSRVRLRDDISSTQLPLLLRDRQGYGLHRLFWDLFSDGNKNTQKRNFLFREEVAQEQLGHGGKRKNAPIYYVLSKQQPARESPLFDVESKVYQPVLSEGGRFGFKLRVNAVVSRDGKRHDIVMDEQQQWLRSQLEEMDLKSLGKKNELKSRLLDNADDSVLASWQDLIVSGAFGDKLGQALGRQDTLNWAIKTIVEKRIQRWWCAKGERLGFEVPKNKEGGYYLENMAYRKYALPEKSTTAGFSSLDLSGEVVVRDVDQFRRLLFEGVGPSKAFGCGLMMIRRL